LPVADNAANSPLLKGMEALEQALALPVGAPEAARLLETAQQSLQRAVELDGGNPMAHFLLSNCLYNMYRARKQSGDVAGARPLAIEFIDELREAYENRGQLDDPALRTEIEADYELIVRRNTPEAINLYKQLLDESLGVDGQTTKRAQWMLSGIYCGDWRVDKKYVDPDKAKECLVQILALWPDSKEAEFIKRVLRWNESEKRTRFEYFPRQLEDDELEDRET
jgi:hypothetical protein